MTDNASQDFGSGDEVFPAEASSDCGTGETRAFARPARSRRGRLRTRFALAVALVLSPHTADVSTPQAPDAGSVQRSSVLGEMSARGPALRELASAAEGRMTPEQLTLFREILEIRDGFEEPVDVNSLLRQIREDV